MLMDLRLRLGCVAACALVTSVGCRTPQPSGALDAEGSPNAPSFSALSVNTARMPRVLEGSQVCIERWFSTDTDVGMPVADAKVRPADGVQHEERTVFQTDESTPAANAYWMALAAYLAYLQPEVAEVELKHFWGVTDFKFFSQTRKVFDTQAYLAEVSHDPTKDIPPGVLAGDAAGPRGRPSVGDMVILAFRGTEIQKAADIRTNIAVQPRPLLGPGGVLIGHTHGGFISGLDAVWPDLIAEVRRIKKPIWVTGHSLGAGLATLAAARLLAERQHDIETTGRSDIDVRALYAFASPRTGLSDFVDRFNSLAAAHHVKTRRYFNRNDIVPSIPEGITGTLFGGFEHLRAGGWKHVGVAGPGDRLVYYKEARSLRSLQEAETRLKSSIWAKLAGGNWVKDHDPARYVIKAELDAFGHRCTVDPVEPQEAP
jgi:hypothetical protein